MNWFENLEVVSKISIDRYTAPKIDESWAPSTGPFGWNLKPIDWRLRHSCRVTIYRDYRCGKVTKNRVSGRVFGVIAGHRTLTQGTPGDKQQLDLIKKVFIRPLLDPPLLDEIRPLQMNSGMPSAIRDVRKIVWRYPPVRDVMLKDKSMMNILTWISRSKLMRRFYNTWLTMLSLLNEIDGPTDFQIRKGGIIL